MHGYRRPSASRLAFGFGKATHTAKSSLSPLQLPGCHMGSRSSHPAEEGHSCYLGQTNLQSTLQTRPNICTSSWDFTIGTNSPGSRTPTN
ncbi:hypothetical protein ACRRTK_017166 [Alexandromys fortis]